MSQENVEGEGGVRTNLSPRGERASQRRALDERLLVHFPAAYALAGRFWMRLPLRSRLRRMLLTRSVPRTCAALSRRDFDVFLLGFDPNVEFRGTRDVLGPDQIEVTYGHGGLLGFLHAWFDVIEDLRYEPQQVLDLGDRFLVTVHLSGRGSGSGVAVSMRFFVLSHVERGLVIKQENFVDQPKALEAAGLRE